MITAQERKALDYIAGRTLSDGVCPSYPEIARALCLKETSKGRVARIINELVARGKLRRLANRARALELTPESRAEYWAEYRGKPLIEFANAAYFVVEKVEGEDAKLVPLRR